MNLNLPFMCLFDNLFSAQRWNGAFSQSDSGLVKSSHTDEDASGSTAYGVSSRFSDARNDNDMHTVRAVRTECHRLLDVRGP